MITYFEKLTDAEKDDLQHVIQTLYRQTFLLERKFDKKTGRMSATSDYRICSRHLDFLREYFEIGGITLKESVHMGLIYIQGQTLWGEKLPRLATIYLLILKLLYDEQLASAFSGSNVIVSMGMINGKAGEFKVLSGLPSLTEMRRSIALLKRFQLIEPLDILEELGEDTRFVIYPSINAVLTADDIRAVLNTFSEEEYSGEEAIVQGTFEDLSE